MYFHIPTKCCGMTHTRVLLVLSVVVCCAGLIVPGSRQRGPSIRPARPSSTEPELEPEPEPEPLDGSEDELAMDGDEEANEAAEAEADAAKAAARTRRVPRDPSIEEFEALIAMKPDYCVAYLHLGSCLLEEDRAEDAITVLEQARQLSIDQSHTAPRQEAEMLLEQAREDLE